MIKSLIFLLVVLLSFSFIGIGYAEEEFPSQPITIVVPFSAGGISDSLARLIDGVSVDYFPVRIRVVVMPGGGGIEGAKYVVDSKPDGYTLLYTSNTNMLGSAVLRDIGFDPVRDLIPVIGFSRIPTILGVRKDASWKTLADFVEDAKANPKKITIGTPGIGSHNHFGLEIMARALGIEITHVPFDGGAEVNMAVAGGHIDGHAGTTGAILQGVNSDQLKALVVLGQERDKSFPDVPTAIEEGYDIFWESTRGMFAPKDTPSDRLKWLEEHFIKIMEAPSFIIPSTQLGEGPTYTSSDELKKLMLHLEEEMKQIAKEVML